MLIGKNLLEDTWTMLKPKQKPHIRKKFIKKAFRTKNPTNQDQ